MENKENAQNEHEDIKYHGWVAKRKGNISVKSLRTDIVE